MPSDRPGAKAAREDTYGEAAGSSKTYTYACDGCGEPMEVAEGAISIAGGELYCDNCGGRP